jgi:hypothetical protein
MMQYLYMQAQPIVQHFAAKMYNNGTYSLLQDETVPLLDSDANDDDYTTHPYHPSISWYMGVPLGPMCSPQGAQQAKRIR